MLQNPPNGMPVFYPVMLYDDAPAAIDWLERVFGMERQLVAPGERGTIAHAELRLGAGIVMVSTRRPGQASGKGPYVYVADPRAHHDHAVANGAQVTREYEEKDYGGAGYSVLDCEGNEWSFGSYVPEPAFPVYAATPYLACGDAAAAIAFYERAFGAEERGERYVDEDGRVGHAELAIGPVTVYVSDEYPELEVLGPGSLGGASQSIVLGVADVDATFARAVDAGATVLRDPKDEPYGRMATLRDPAGHRWMLNGPVRGA